jgi:hypothetical protein
LGNGRYLLEGIADDGATVSEELSTDELVANLSEADILDEHEGPMGPRLRSLLDLAEAEADENLVKIRIVLEGLRGEASIAELCRKEGINQNLYDRWPRRIQNMIYVVRIIR